MDTETRNARFQELFFGVDTHRIERNLRKFAVGCNLTRQDAEDAWGYALTQSLNVVESFQGTSENFGGWLFSTARNYLRRLLEKGNPTTCGYWKLGNKVSSYRVKGAKWIQIDQYCGRRVMLTNDFDPRSDSRHANCDAHFLESGYEPTEASEVRDFGSMDVKYKRADQIAHPRRIKSMRVSVSPEAPAPQDGRGVVLYNFLKAYGRPAKSGEIRPFISDLLKARGFAGSFKWTDFKWLTLEY